MNIIGAKVKHKKFGEGTVVSINENLVSIKFSDNIKEFAYPAVFKEFVKFEDQTLQSEIDSLINITEEQERIEKEQTEKEREERINKIHENHQTTTNQTKSNQDNNIAFKCTYCDGGQDNNIIGFCNICSDDILRANINNGRTWCCAAECYCRKYYDGSITREELEKIYNKDNSSICYESNLFRSWYYEAGIVVKKSANKGKPNTIRGGKYDSLCVLTTQKPGADKKERYIFGVFIIGKLNEGDDVKAGRVSANPKYKIALSETEAKSMCFWNYYKNKNGNDPYKWGSGLFRYINNQTAINILNDIVKLKKGTDDEQLAVDMLNYYTELNK